MQISSSNPADGLTLLPLVRVQPVAPSGPDPGTASAQAGGGAEDDAVHVDVLGAGPPPELQAAIGAAANAYDQLSAAGQHVSFSTDPETGAFHIQLQDPDGKVLSTLSPSQVLGLADSNATDQTRKSPDVNQQRQPGD